jgi:SPP1 gp7 family putative phage head morphogenesis protein
MESYHKDSNEVIHKINAAYDEAIKEINQDINNIFYQFTRSGDLTLDQTKRMLNQKIPNPLIKIYKKILPHIGNDDIKQWFIARINSRAYKARMTRLEAIKESIYANIKRVADVEVEQSSRLYLNNLNKSYYRNTYDIQKGIGQIYDFSPLPGSFVEEMLKSRWSGKNYSERIWNNNEVLAAKLEEVVTSGLMSGKSSRRMAKELEDMTMYGKFATERLIRTETTYVTNQGELESYKAAGIEEYIFLATLDLRTSEQCRVHDNKKYKVSEAVAGENLPPLHPYCRSTTRAYLEDKKRGPRRARDPLTRDTYLIDNMSYEDWYQKFVVEKYGEQNAVKFERMIKKGGSSIMKKVLLT